MSVPPDIAALIAEADAALEFYQPSNIDYMGLVKELRDALEALASDAARWRYFRDDMDDGDKLHMIANGTDHYDAAIDRARGKT